MIFSVTCYHNGGSRIRASNCLVKASGSMLSGAPMATICVSGFDNLLLVSLKRLTRFDVGILGKAFL